MNDITKVEYSRHIKEVGPVKKIDFPVTEFIGYGSDLINLYETEKGKTIVEVQEEKFIQEFNKLVYVYGHPSLNAPYHYNPETGIWNEISLGNYKFSDWYYENALRPIFNDSLKISEVGNSIGKELKKVSKSLATRAMIHGEGTPLGEKPNADLIAFTNGTYDFKTNEIRETKMEDYHTVQLPYPLLKEDDESKILAVEWVRFILEENAQAMFEWIGYMFYRDYKYQNIAFLINDPKKSKSGSNGKSQLGGFIVNKLMGYKNTSAVGLDLLSDSKNRFDKASLHHKLVNFEADSSANFMSGTNTLKKLSGGKDTIHAEKKGTDAFSFVNYAKLMFSMNELPSFSDRTNGWYRRLLIIPFPKDFSTDKYSKELNQFNKEENERESDEQLGKFAWYCIQQYKKILDKGANGENPFTQTQTMEHMKEDYIESNDPALDFLKEVPVIVKEEDGFIPMRELKKIFTVYTKENNVNKNMKWTTIRALLVDSYPETSKRVDGSTKTTKGLSGLSIGFNEDAESDDIQPYLMNALHDTDYVNIFNNIK